MPPAERISTHPFEGQRESVRFNWDKITVIYYPSKQFFWRLVHLPKRLSWIWYYELLEIYVYAVTNYTENMTLTKVYGGI